MSLKPKSIILMSQNRLQDVYGPRELEQIKEISELVCEPTVSDEATIDQHLEEVEFIFGGWGMPELTKPFLDKVPNLRGVFYSAGTVKPYVTEDFWAREIVITNAHRANAVPVAEYCLATILFSLKLGWRSIRHSREAKAWKQHRSDIPGCYDATVGLISLGAIGYKTLELLEPFEIKPLIYSSSYTEEAARARGGEVVDLDELFERSDVVSLHTPLLPSTEGMIRGDHFRKMKRNATFINTARGAVVNQDEMIQAMRERPDLTCLLDVVDPEPPEPGSEILSVDNIHVTTHIAGSLGRECRRLGQTAIDECKRFMNGQDLWHEVVENDLVKMA